MTYIRDQHDCHWKDDFENAVACQAKNFKDYERDRAVVAEMRQLEGELACSYPWPDMLSKPDECGNPQAPCIKHRLREMLNRSKS